MMKPYWQQFIDHEKSQPYFKSLISEIEQQRTSGVVVYPPDEAVFSAFEYCDLTDVNVVILGQDPYHGAGQAHGLAFSVLPDIKIPPSLVNIYKELQTDIAEFSSPSHGYLVEWAKQGVLLLNTVLTVQQGQAHSHAKLGWEQFTDRVIHEINRQNPHCVFILWGAHAQKKGRDIDHQKHCVLLGPHPSPLSAYRGFFGCRHFSKANTWLQQHGKASIDWRISDLD